MIHFVISLIYLCLTALLVLGYVYLFRVIIRYIIQLIKEGKQALTRKRFTLFPYKNVYSVTRKVFVKSCAFALVVTTGFFIYERSRWMIADVAYPAARNYFVTGMVLIDFRTFGHYFIYPERMIWKPVVWLQQLIMATGLSLIPDDDAERAVWSYHFVLAPYINRIHAPRDNVIYSLIDTSRFVLKSLVKDKMVDPRFDRENRYIIYPLATLYYQYIYKFQYDLTPSPKRYYEGLYKDRAQYLELQQVVEWAIQMEKQWDSLRAVREYMNRNPEIELAHLVSVSLMLHEILRYQIQNLEYSCDDRYLKLYYEYVTRYESDQSPYHHVDRQLQRSYDTALIYRGSVINFFGHRLCNLPKLPYYTMRAVVNLSAEGDGWYESFLELNKRLVPKERQQEVLERIEPWGSE